MGNLFIEQNIGVDVSMELQVTGWKGNSFISRTVSHTVDEQVSNGFMARPACVLDNLVQSVEILYSNITTYCVWYGTTNASLYGSCSFCQLNKVVCFM